jgi:hypothetical protein
MGELLKQFDGSTRNGAGAGAHTTSQKQVAESAGISKHQQTQAVRVANVTEGAQLGGKVVCRRAVAAPVRYFELG